MSFSHEIIIFKGFRRLTGIQRSTFNKMLSILKAAEVVRKAKGGKPVYGRWGETLYTEPKKNAISYFNKTIQILFLNIE